MYMPLVMVLVWIWRQSSKGLTCSSACRVPFFAARHNRPAFWPWSATAAW